MKLLRFRFGAPLGAALLLAGCVTPPPTRAVSDAPLPPTQRIFVYPASGQSAEQTDRDRYDCHLWAVEQTGFDPSRADAYPDERVLVQPATPPGAGTVVGAIGGAILGSMIAGPGDAGAGLVLGGATGAIIGSASDANAQAQARQTQGEINQGVYARRTRADAYRRAIGACLKGRGYSVS